MGWADICDQSSGCKLVQKWIRVVVKVSILLELSCQVLFWRGLKYAMLSRAVLPCHRLSYPMLSSYVLPFAVILSDVLSCVEEMWEPGLCPLRKAKLSVFSTRISFSNVECTQWGGVLFHAALHRWAASSNSPSESRRNWRRTWRASNASTIISRLVCY